MIQTLELDAAIYSAAECAHGANIPAAHLQQHLHRRITSADRQAGQRGQFMFSLRSVLRVAVAARLNQLTNMSLRECYGLAAEFSDSGDGPCAWGGPVSTAPERLPGAECFADGEPAVLRLGCLVTGERRCDVVRLSEAVADGFDRYENISIINLASVVRGTRMRLGL